MAYPKFERELQPGEGVRMKERLALVTRVLADGGIIPSVFGHCTCRVPGSDRIYITPHFHWEGRVMQEVTANDIHLMDMDGNTLGSVSTGKERQVKVILVEHKEAVSELLRAVLEGCGNRSAHPGTT